MNDEQAFLAEIRAYPDDDDRRLVYADFLEDQGDPRGELIRVQIERERLPAIAPQRADLLRREDALLAAHGERWLEPLRRLGVEGLSIRSFERGLIEQVSISAKDFVRSAESLCASAAALGCVRLRSAQEAAESLARMAWPAQIVGLDLASSGITADLLARWQEAPWTRQLRTLRLQANPLQDEGAAALAAWQCPRLEELQLGMTQLTPQGLGRLLRWPTFWRLRILGLSLNPLQDRGLLEILDAGPPLPEVYTGQDVRSAAWQAVDLMGTGISNATLGPGFVWRNLQRLSLRANRIQQAGWEALAEHFGHQLRWLDARDNRERISERLAERFIHATVLR